MGDYRSNVEAKEDLEKLYTEIRRANRFRSLAYSKWEDCSDKHTKRAKELAEKMGEWDRKIAALERSRDVLESRLLVEAWA